MAKKEHKHNMFETNLAFGHKGNHGASYHTSGRPVALTKGELPLKEGLFPVAYRNPEHDGMKHGEVGTKMGKRGR